MATTTKTPAIPTPDHLTVCRAMSLALITQRPKPVRARHVGEKLYGDEYLLQLDAWYSRRTDTFKAQYKAVTRGLKSAKDAGFLSYDSKKGWRLRASGQRLAAGDQ
ncbi:MAG: hypothetical protein EOO70_04105 [Myxococcaceae bacterium]|nr:MAG: hypothetical protein EOO70_04105 [Myxococcaceae bacterium]